MFTTTFDKYVCDGDSITCEVDGYELKATIRADEDSGPPWENEDGHGPVSEWRRGREKRAGELLLHSDNGFYRFYDFEGAVKIAKRDGWGPGEPHEAARRDFEALRAWCRGEWCYVGVVLSVARNGVMLDEHAASLWGIDANHPHGNNDYLREVANELLPEALETARMVRAKILA